MIIKPPWTWSASKLGLQLATVPERKGSYSFFIPCKCDFVFVYFCFFKQKNYYRVNLTSLCVFAERFTSMGKQYSELDLWLAAISSYCSQDYVTSQLCFLKSNMNLFICPEQSAVADPSWWCDSLRSKAARTLLFAAAFSSKVMSALFKHRWAKHGKKTQQQAGKTSSTQSHFAFSFQ